MNLTLTPSIRREQRSTTYMNFYGKVTQINGAGIAPFIIRSDSPESYTPFRTDRSKTMIPCQATHPRRPYKGVHPPGALLNKKICFLIVEKTMAAC